MTSSQDGAAYVWNVANGQRELLLVGATGATTGAAFSPDGSEIATASADRLGRIYYSQDGRLLGPLAGHVDALTSIGFDPSGRTVVTASSDGSARLWDALPQGTLTPIVESRQPAHTLFVGRHAVVLAGRRARVLTTAGRLLTTITMRAPVVAAAGEGSTVAAIDARGDLATSSVNGLRTERENGLGATALASASGGRLLVGTAHGTVWGREIPAREVRAARSSVSPGGSSASLRAAAASSCGCRTSFASTPTRGSW